MKRSASKVKKNTKAALAAAASSSGIQTPMTFSPYFKKLSREFFDQDSFALSRALLGKVLARKLSTGEVVRGTIVETEAYPGLSDPASHSFNLKRTERNKAMFMEPGTSYVYFTYGMYHCFNISSKGEGAAVLLRGLELVQDYESVRKLRERSLKKRKITTKNGNEVAEKRPEMKFHDIANGPGKLCLAFDIDRASCDQLDLVTSDMMWVENNEDPKFHEGNFDIEIATRIGLFSCPDSAKNEMYRYFIANNFSVSTAKPSQIRKKLAELERKKEEQQENGDQ